MPTFFEITTASDLGLLSSDKDVAFVRWFIVSSVVQTVIGKLF